MTDTKPLTIDAHGGRVSVARADDKEPLIAVMILAFATDPVARWMYGDPQRYAVHFGRFIRAGSALLAEALRRCDREHMPAYLESSNPINAALYGRFGFEPLGVIRAGNSPPMVPMLRRGR